MFYGGALYSTIAPLAILGMIVLAILALSGRSEADARGERAYVLYLSLVSFVALFTLLFALVDLGSTAIDSLVDEVGCVDPAQPGCFDDFGGSGYGGEPAARGVINSVAVALVAGAVLVFHRRRSQDLVRDEAFRRSAGARTFTAYLYAVAFTAMVILLVAAAISLPAALGVIAPGLTAPDSTELERNSSLRALVPALLAAGGAALIYVGHWREADRLRRGGDDD